MMEKGHARSKIPVRRKPRKIMVIKPSRYEAHESIHANKTYWHNVLNPSDSEDSEDTESKKISKVLPPELYEKVCDALNIDPQYETTTEELRESVKEVKKRTVVKEPFITYRKTFIVEREAESDTDVEISPRDKARDKVNIHSELLKKPEREQISWATRYLQPEREDEKTLVRKADDLTNRIVEDFCKYMKDLGGDQQSKLFTPKAIKELFEIEFNTHASRGLSVVPMELHTVNEKIANITGNPQLSQYSALEREVSKDIQADRRPDRLLAFSRSLPIHDQWHAPRNDTKNLWRSSKYVPKDVVTLKTVWEGITNLRSVKEYCRWMIDHPEYKRAPYLSSLGLFDTAVLNSRLTFESGNELSPMHITNTEVKHDTEHIDHIALEEMHGE